MDFINILKLARLDSENNGRGLILKLMSWKVIAQEGQLKCPKGHPLTLAANSSRCDGVAWKCRESYLNRNKKRVKCDFVVSIRKNTFFERSHLPLLNICTFVNLWAQNASLNLIQIQAEIAKQTAVDWASFCREVVETVYIFHKTPLGGEGKVVEIDESKFGRRKYHRGHRVEGQWVFGGVERQSGRCFLVPVGARNAGTLLEVIREWILPGTTIISDCWKAYDTLEKEGFAHLQVNHSLHFVDPDTGAHTNTIESTWRHAKESMPSYHRKKAFYSGYLAKYMFLKSCRTSGVDPTVEFFKYAAKVYSPTRESTEIREEEEEVEEEEEEEEEDEEEDGVDHVFA